MVPHQVQFALHNALCPDRFLVAAPGRVRIESSNGLWQVFLDTPAFPLDRPIIEVLGSSGSLLVRRNLRLRDQSWLSEHIGGVPFQRTDLLTRCIAMALTGTSRLPITSVETPHPVFTLGLLAYSPPESGSVLDRARDIEARLRIGGPVPEPITDLPAVVKTLFHHLALSPYGVLAPNLINLVLGCRREVALDLLGYMLRHLARHLNAFDLVRFHNLGANYPDALFVDELLRAFIDLLDGSEDRMLRRALRQGFLARKRCDGLRVPDRPSSLGDNSRDCPAPAVPTAQLTDPGTRKRRLFVNCPADSLLTPVAAALLAQSLDDLSDPAECRELGTAVFLDRPLGVAKRAGEEDRTTLLSIEACSARLIRKGLADLGALASLPIPDITGLPVSRLPGHARQGVVSLEDAKKVALDFVFTRTTRSSLDDLMSHYSFDAVNAAAPDAYQWLRTGHVLLIRTSRTKLVAFDSSLAERLDMTLPDPARYVEIGGREYLEDFSCDVDGRSFALPPCW